MCGNHCVEFGHDVFVRNHFAPISGINPNLNERAVIAFAFSDASDCFDCKLDVSHSSRLRKTINHRQRFCVEEGS